MSQLPFLSHTQSRYLRPSDIEAEYGIPRGTVWSMISRGQIPHTRYGLRAVLIAREDLEQYLASRAVPVRAGQGV